jgi:hypothetical protein
MTAYECSAQDDGATIASERASVQSRGSRESTEDPVAKWIPEFPGHTFDLGTFIDGKMPPQTEVALTQTLVSLK